MYCSRRWSDHDGKLSVRLVGFRFLVDERRAALLVCRKLRTDEVIVAQRTRHVFGDHVHGIQTERAQLGRGRKHFVDDFFALLRTLQRAGKRIARKVARQAHARGHVGCINIIHACLPR